MTQKFLFGNRFFDKHRKRKDLGGMALSLWLAGALLFVSCSSGKGPGASGEIVQPRHAKGFYFIKEKNFTRLIVRRPWQGADKDLFLALVKEGDPDPKEIPAAAKVRVPVKRMALASVPQLAFAEALGSLDRVAGLSGTAYLYSPGARARVASNLIRDLSGTAGAYNGELLMVLKPDLVVAQAVDREGAEKALHLSDQGLPLVFMGEWLEEHPLARAEWVKVMGALVGREKEADKLFAEVENAYMHMMAMLAQVEVRPKVMVGLPFKGTWYVPGGASYLAALIDDAGGDYLWKGGNERGGVAMSLEAVAEKARGADIWIHPYGVDSLGQLRRVDPRLADFGPLQQGAVYGNTKRTNGLGGNDYYETGVLKPHELLADLAIIFHPEMLGTLTAKYHEKLK